MAYSELIKDFSRIRDYIRDFYVYGFKSRRAYDAKSARGYDNERRRVESWLGERMMFRQDSDGKRVFISIDSGSVKSNPLYKAFKAKSFTTNDITLSFNILDALEESASYTARELTEKLTSEYISDFDIPPTLDESIVRLKLKEYEDLGLLISEKQGNRIKYRRSVDQIDLLGWADALSFFSEEDPLGVVGSYLLDKLDREVIEREGFRFKHHYILHALESEVLYELLLSIEQKREARIDIYNPRRGKPSSHTITPLKILVSAQGGRRYLLAFAHIARRINLYRLDSIKNVRLLESDDSFDSLSCQASGFISHLWGVSAGNYDKLEHIEMVIHAGPGEEYIHERLEREKRCGSVEALGKDLYRFSADVYDTAEMLPWLRTFIGRIVSLNCDNKKAREAFFADIRAMEEMYPEDLSDAIS